jgi:hypothetical protein
MVLAIIFWFKVDYFLIIISYDGLIISDIYIIVEVKFVFEI